MKIENYLFVNHILIANTCDKQYFYEGLKVHVHQICPFCVRFSHDSDVSHDAFSLFSRSLLLTDVQFGRYTKEFDRRWVNLFS